MMVFIGGLANFYGEGDLNIDFEFQNVFSWDNHQNKIDRINIVGLPIPSICVFEDEECGWEVIDGLQRLHTIFSFIGKKNFNQWKLGEGDILKNIKGFSYDDLPIRARILFRR